MLATAATVALSLAIVAMPTLGATADEANPDEAVVETALVVEEPAAAEPPATEPPATEALASESAAEAAPAPTVADPGPVGSTTMRSTNASSASTICTEIAGGPGWGPKVDTVGDPPTVPYTAPAGFLVDKYCVKAGPTAIIVVVDPPSQEVTIDYPDIDSVSHYMVHLIPKPHDECPNIEDNQAAVPEGMVKTESGDCEPPVEDCEPVAYEVRFVTSTQPADCDVEPKLTPTHETCVAGQGDAPGSKVNGSIMITFEEGGLDDIEKIEYSLKGADDWTVVVGTTIDNLPPGTYEVRFTVKPGHTLTGANPLEVTIQATTSDDCKKIVICHWNQGGQGDLGSWNSIEVSVNAVKNAGHYDPPSDNSTHNFDIIPPFDGNTGKNWDESSSYLAAEAFAEYPFLGSTGEELWPNCATPDKPVTVTWEKEHEQCIPGQEGAPGTLVGGSITLFFDPDADGIAKVEYRLAGSMTWLEYTAPLTDLDPGIYEFQVTAKDGYDVDPSMFSIEIVADDSVDCVDLPDEPIVEAWASFEQLTCKADGSYTFGATPAEEGEPTPTVYWTVNGDPATEGTYDVSGPTEVTIEAMVNGPDYGFADGQQTEWTFTFTKPTGCDLPTLALTGGDTAPAMAVAAFLGLLGAALVRSAARVRRTAED